MDEKNIYHLSYVSTACDSLRFDQIKEILDESRSNNSGQHITGMLIYCNKHFFQILEGDKESVEELYAKITCDPRHDNVIKLHAGFVPYRQFENWNMGFKSYNKELKPLDNFNTEEFYGFVKSKLNGSNAVSLKILADFFDLNG
jgi:hypothetical protein